MNKLSTRFLSVILTFVMGISFVAGWLYYQETQQNKLILPNSRWEQLFFNGVNNGPGGINRATELAGINELRKTRLKEGETEIRVWRGFGLKPLEAVILKHSNNQWSAKYLNYDFVYEKSELKELDPPKSGWQSFWKQIDEKGILRLPDASEIGCGDDGGVDGITYVVEINLDKTYRTYRLSPDYSPGKCRAVNLMEEIGDIIGQEFNSDTQECTRMAEWFACTKAGKAGKEKNQ